MVGGKRGSVWFPFPKDEYVSVESVCAQANFDSCFEARICHLSVYGCGQGSLIDKRSSTNNINLMEEGTEMHKDLVSEVYGVLADQGTEKGMADIDQSVNSALCGANPLEWTDKLGHLYPNALWMPEHLHIIFNPLEAAVCKLVGHDNWLSLLKAVENFLSDSTLRRLFVDLFVGQS